MKLIALALLLVASSLTVTAQHTLQLPAGAELILKTTYKAGFTCEGRKYGYYADQDNNCQVFHVCVPIATEEGIITDTIQYSFVCGNKTVFDQEFLTCANEAVVDCSAAAALYVVNDNFGVIPPRN